MYAALIEKDTGFCLHLDLASTDLSNRINELSIQGRFVVRTVVSDLEMLEMAMQTFRRPAPTVKILSRSSKHLKTRHKERVSAP